MDTRDGLESREGGDFFEVLGRGVDGDCLACNRKRRGGGRYASWVIAGWGKKGISLTRLRGRRFYQ